MEVRLRYLLLDEVGEVDRLFDAVLVTVGNFATIRSLRESSLSSALSGARLEDDGGFFVEDYVAHLGVLSQLTRELYDVHVV